MPTVVKTIADVIDKAKEFAAKEKPAARRKNLSHAEAAARFEAGRKGTVQELLARGMKINGRHVSAVDLSVLAKFGIGECVGDGVKPKTGRTPKVYSYAQEYQLKVTIDYMD